MFSDVRVRTRHDRARRPAALTLMLTLNAVFLGLAHLTTPAPCRAAAISVSETEKIPLTATNWSPGSPGSVTNPLQFSKFDPSLGTLNSVKISLNYTFQHDLTLTFTSAATLNLSTLGSQVVVNNPNGGFFLKGVPTPVSETRSDSAGPYPKTVTIPTITQTGSSGPITLNSAADLALFTAKAAGDKIGLPVMGQSNSVFLSSTGNGSGRINSTAGAEVTVSYTYTPVPEPSTLAVLGLGGAALLAWRRRKAGL